MAKSNKYECWGLSLSLKPPITHHDHHPIPTSTNKQIPNVEETKSATSKVVPKIIGMDIKPIVPLVIEMEDIKATKKNSPNKYLSNYTSVVKLPLYNSSIFGKNTWHDGDSGGGNGGSGGKEERKKLRLCKDQVVVLEQAFREHMTLNTKQKVALARQVNLRPRQVEVWFQNRRARTKLKQTEIDCEHLRRFCEALTEENKKLHKEVQQLRALNTSSPHHTNNLPTNLTLCPSCKTADTGPHTVEILHRQP